MCADSSAKLKGEEVNIYMGHYGGSISIGNFKYSVGDDVIGTRDELVTKLKAYRKEDLAKLIADLIDNAEEG